MEIVLTLTVLVTTLICFVTEILPVDLVAIIVMVALMVLGLVTPEQGISGTQTDLWQSAALPRRISTRMRNDNRQINRCGSTTATMASRKQEATTTPVTMSPSSKN